MRRIADAVVVTPAHQHPTGAVLSSERRTELVAWLRERGTTSVEDDYDAEYRYDRAAVGAVQGLEPDRVVYAGSASKTLAPALRLGWLVVPSAMLDAVRDEKLLADRGTARIEQLAFTDFLTSGHLDRHLRRMRLRYGARRQALVEALADALPEAAVHGIAAGLHVTVELPPGDDEAAIREEALERRIALSTMSDYGEHAGRPTLMLGYGHLSEAAVAAGRPRAGGGDPRSPRTPGLRSAARHEVEPVVGVRPVGPLDPDERRGHIHTYARFAPQDADGHVNPEHGIRQFIVGTGGKSQGSLPGSTNVEFTANGFGVLKLRLHAASYDWRFVAVDGSVVDSGSAACH